MYHKRIMGRMQAGRGSVMETVFPNGSALLQQDNERCTSAKNVREWFEE